MHTEKCCQAYLLQLHLGCPYQLARALSCAACASKYAQATRSIVQVLEMAALRLLSWPAPGACRKMHALLCSCRVRVQAAMKAADLPAKRMLTSTAFALYKSRKRARVVGAPAQSVSMQCCWQCQDCSAMLETKVHQGSDSSTLPA